MSTTTTEVGPVSRVQIARYAGAVQDFNPVHVDETFAKEAGLPSVIAHGPLTLSLVVDALVRQHGVHALRDFDARLRMPVFPGDVLTVAPSEEGVVVTNARGDIVATARVEFA
jgi:acyl dehydratase